MGQTPDIINLLQSKLLNLKIEWHDEIEANTPIEDSYSFDYEVFRYNTDDRVYRVDFSVTRLARQGKRKVDTEILAKISGIFSMPESIVEEAQKAFLIRVNGCTVLYGILRGQIAIYSGSFPGQQVLLPTVHMESVLREIDSRKNVGLKPPTEKEQVLTSDAGSKPKRIVRKKNLKN